MEIVTAAGGGLLSVSFENLLDKLASFEVLQFVSNKEVPSELQKWKNMLPQIQAVLADAEHKENTFLSVKHWLSDLRDLMYDVENVMDEFATEALRIKHKDAAAATTTGSTKKKVLKILPSCFTARTGLKFDARMGSQLEEITGRLQATCAQMTELHLGDNVVGRRVRRESSTRRETTSLPESHIFGRDKDKQAILDLLLGNGDGSRVSVISIHGMGGLGKTTLAQQLYKDEKVKVNFQYRAWVCVSDTFDVLSITKTILQGVGVEVRDDRYLDQLQLDLLKALCERRFFIVLDDCWSENYEDWAVLFKPLMGGALGSKIIVTTRNKNVGNVVWSTQAYPLQVLLNEDCLSLFAQCALGATNFDGYPHLEDIGQKIVEKCKGLPLAARTFGELLRTKCERYEWEDILECQIWDLPEKYGILRSLRLSYHHLPSQLKQCFTYCAIFPKGYTFDMDEIVLLWMAEGFLSDPKRNKHLEDVGTRCFHDLLSWSFFQPFSKDSSKFVMHDLIHDLALDAAGETCFHLDASVERREHLPTRKTRHLSFSPQFSEFLGRYEIFDEAKNLQTLLRLPTVPCCDRHISDDVLNNLLSKLGNLRALSLRGYKIQKVPETIKGLKHIRYLNLSQTVIRFLPEFVCSLFNLQTLLLTNCEELEKLPTGIGSIPNLCHLDIHGTKQLKEMPAGIGNLTNIRTLGKFIVGLGEADGLNIRELKNLSQLKGELCLEGLHNVEKSEDAREADLRDKLGLKGLVMRWSDNMDDHMSKGSAENIVLEWLKPPSHVERLAIEFYYGLEFPLWLGDPLSIRNIMEIELCNCGKSTSLPSLGRLPMLKHLIIKGMSAVKSLGFEFSGCDSGGFPALETLKFEDMQAWEKWSSSVGTATECGWKFPCLHKLEMLNCPVLEGECLVSLPSLRKLKLKKCNESLLKCMVDTGSLTSLSIGEMSGLSCLHDGVGQLFVQLEDLEIYMCERLVYLWPTESEFEDNMTRLRSLEVRSCPEFVSLFTGPTINKMPSLENMSVEECPGISSIQNDQQQDMNDKVKLPLKLRYLELDNCGEQCVGNGVVVIRDECILVDYLEVRGCDTLQHLAIKSRRGGKKVKHMRIEDCRNLVSITNSYRITEKQEEEEDGKEEWDDKIPRTGTVEIEELQIFNCPSLTSDGLNSLVAVKKLHIHSCQNLKGMPNNMQCLTALTHLIVSDCGGLESFQGEGSLPPNLIELTIEGCPNLKQNMSKWDTLSSLEALRIVDVGDGDFKDMFLPSSLTSLRIGKSPKLSTTASSSRCFNLHNNLTSLEFLQISDCPKLMCLQK